MEWDVQLLSLSKFPGEGILDEQEQPALLSQHHILL